MAEVETFIDASLVYLLLIGLFVVALQIVLPRLSQP